MIVEMFFLAYTSGTQLRPPVIEYASIETCKKALSRETKKVELSLPENYRIVSGCKPAGVQSLRDLAGENGFNCFKYGKCGDPNAPKPVIIMNKDD
jgi:hypothetical protein